MKEPPPPNVKALLDELRERFPDWRDLVIFIKTRPDEFRALLKKHRVKIADTSRIFVS